MVQKKEMSTWNVPTIKWYRHSKALSCELLYLRNNVIYTLIAIAKFHKASAGRNLCIFSTHPRVSRYSSSHLDEEALELAEMRVLSRSDTGL